MVGDFCNVDWLSEQLMSTGNETSGTSTVPDDGDVFYSTTPAAGSDQLVNCSSELVDSSTSTAQPQQLGKTVGGSVPSAFCLKCPCERRRRIVILDCRSPSDYLTSHIVGAVHLAVPQLMLRRLTTGNLPVSSVIGCLQDEGRENVDRRWKSEIIVLHDERSLDVITDVTASTMTPGTSSHVVSVLLKRLKEDGCRVCLLRGGFEAFSHKYPHLCVTPTSESGCFSGGVDDLDNDDGINVDEDDLIDEPFGDNGPSLSLSTSCRSAPPTSSTTTTALGLQRLRLQRHNRSHRLAGHRLTMQQIYHQNVHHHHHHHPHHVSSCNNQFSCPSSLSSSSLSSCCSSTNSSNSSSVSSSSLSISGPPHTSLSSFPVEVLPYLYLGNARSSADIDALRRNGIRYILNVTPNVPNSFAGSDAFRYLQIPIDDHWSQDLTAYFPNAIAFIDEARRGRCGVLVHCLAGVSRSVTVTVAYLMHALQLTLNDAFDHVRHCKPDISPNFSFMGQLLDYERSLSAERGQQQVAADGQQSTDASLAATEDGLPSQSSVDDDIDVVQPLASIAEPVEDQSMFLSPPAVVSHHRRRLKQQQQRSEIDCQCPPTTTGAHQQNDVSETTPLHCAICCHHHGDTGEGVEVRMSTDLSNGVHHHHHHVAMVTSSGGGGGSSCYSSPVSSLSSLSSSSAVNATMSSTSPSSSSAFDYDTIPMTS